jgi:hypothetical protein
MLTLQFPDSDDGLVQWSKNVLDHITPDPTAYNLVVADVTAYQAVHDSFAAAVTACNPAQRNKPAVVTKNFARDSLKKQANLLGNKVYSSATVTDAQKVELGMPPRATPQPQPAPATAPVIQQVSVSGWTATVRLRDATGARRGKAIGTAGASIFSYAGETPPTDISQWQFEGSVGRVEKIEIPFPTTLAPGSKVWVCGFWFNGKKQSGPVSAPFGMNLPGGTVAMAE